MDSLQPPNTPHGPARRALPRLRDPRTYTKPGAILSILAFTGIAAAAITLSYANVSTVSTGVTPVPVQFLAGDDAGPSALSDYVTSYSISTNKTYVSVAVKGVPEASLVIDSFFKLQNVDDASNSVTLSTSQVTNTYVSTYTIQIYDGANQLVETMTLTSASPAATFSMAAGSTYTAKLTLGLASGAGANNVALTNSLSLAVT